MTALIVFEGGDGSGKTTQARLLFRRLLRGGYDAILTREPGGTAVGEAVRRWLKAHPDRTPVAEFFLFAAARAQHVAQVIAPALSKGQVVVCDRFVASTRAYQGYGRGLDLELISRVNAWATGGLAPDLTVLIDVPPSVGLGRGRAGKPDSFEREAMEFHQRVRDGYLAMAREGAAGWLVVDGVLDRAAVAAKVWQRVKQLLVAAR